MTTATSFSTNATLPRDEEETELKFLALAFAVLQAKERLGKDKKISLLSLLEVPEISHAISVLPDETRNKFSNWFCRLSKDDLSDFSKAYNWQELHINNIGKQLFSNNTAKEKGAIFTPDWLAQRVTNEAFRYWKRLNPGKGSPRRVADLSCGAGIFLSYLRKHASSDTEIIGIDSCAEYVCISRLNAIGDQQCSIECLDTLVDLNSEKQKSLFVQSEVLPISEYDIIVGNPPYIRSQLLNAAYSQKLKNLYPQLTKGNFDLVVLFLAQTLDALSSGGIGALIVSNKFMGSRYGDEICRRLANESRILEIIDFGDGQVFPDKTTYTCAITFAKLPSVGITNVINFPPGLIWDDKGSHFELGQKLQIPQERFQKVPWNLAGDAHDEILRIMHRPNMPLLFDVFPNISQGVRTGANHIFVIKNGNAGEIEQELLQPYVSGENIRRCQIVSTNKHLLWLYKKDDQKISNVIPINELKENYPKAWAYLSNFQKELTDRDLDSSIPWYGYSRTQNLELIHHPKILAREMMPWAEFAADIDGRYNLCSGYAFIAPLNMKSDELNLWAAVLSTPTMEFQLRLVSTQLHSGWFRLLKHHLKKLHLPLFNSESYEKAIALSQSITKDSNNAKKWKALDLLVANSFGLTKEMQQQIADYLEGFHKISNPVGREANDDKKIANQKQFQDDVSEGRKENPAEDIFDLNGDLSDLTDEQKQKYVPVELPEFYPLHRKRENLRRLVTFSANKTAPIHRWYKYTQGFAGEIVASLLNEFKFKKNSTVYDPFAGSGTTLLTCKQLGINSFGSEISPFTSWVAELKVNSWDVKELEEIFVQVKKSKPKPRSYEGLLFSKFFIQAYAPEILNQVVGWRDWIFSQNFSEPLKNFLALGLISILENVSQIRKHGSHYRFLNKIDNIGVGKLNIVTIDSASDIKPLLLEQLELMIADVKTVQFKNPSVMCEVYNIDSTVNAPEGREADIVITSPPYLNRNNYIAQQKAELSLLQMIDSYDEFRSLVKNTFRSHVESNLQKTAISHIPEVMKIVNAIELTENNNAKIPHMVCGYFEDIENTLKVLRDVVKPKGKLAFVVGNSRWGGIVVPVDHLLALIAERMGYKVERILVTRLKGNSPQQMKRFGRIPLRESIVILTR